MLKYSKIMLIMVLVFSQYAYSLQLGDGTKNNSNTFIKVLNDVEDVYLSDYATFAILKDGSLWGTGYNVFKGFEIKGPETTDRFVKIADGVKYYDGFYLIKEDNTLWSISMGIKKIDYNVKKISGNLYIKYDNSLWAIGENNKGIFGNGMWITKFIQPTILRTDIVDVYSCLYYSQIVTDKKDLLISGCHSLPYPYKKTNTFFIIASNVKQTEDGFYIDNKNNLYAFGFNAEGALGVENNQTSKILPTKIMENVNDVSSSQQATLILKKDFTLYGCGGKSINYCGELGFGNKNAVLKPKYIMSEVKKIRMALCHSAIIKKDGTLWTCGANDFPGLY